MNSTHYLLKYSIFACLLFCIIIYSLFILFFFLHYVCLTGVGINFLCTEVLPVISVFHLLLITVLQMELHMHEDVLTAYFQICLHTSDVICCILKSKVQYAVTYKAIYSLRGPMGIKPVSFIYMCSFLFTVLADFGRIPSGKLQGSNEFVTDRRQPAEMYIQSVVAETHGHV